MRLFALAVLVLFASVCRKKSWSQYYQLDGQQSVLLARDGDPAYESEELQQIIAALNAAPEDAKEREQALALAAKLTAERDRLRAERSARLAPRAAPAPALAPPTPVPPETLVSPEPAALDAGPAALPDKPFAGMEERLFVAAFGACFGSGPAATTGDGKSATTQRMKSDDACRKRFAPQSVAPADVDFLFVSGKLWGTRAEEVRIIDAGVRLLPTPDAGVVYLDAGIEMRIGIPGMPYQ